VDNEMKKQDQDLEITLTYEEMRQLIKSYGPPPGIDPEVYLTPNEMKELVFNAKKKREL